ncbi:hypothetical protein CRM22_004279 [Opisthorchis felineus]|uniref:DBC1/CARP1 catalytically inactive NUDIX hydrolase domain-containing protein n=1 Tax=Opisthorchis felineus TaxID=147828 RepID=A0A4S2LWZ1_OPIFE|nr:hypothetical protein CRM22_004279 [Opisthorchis felineus]
MATGGPWSLSMDGANSCGDPRTLINTTIRTFKGYSGLDFTSYTEWIRFTQTRYYRSAATKAPAITGDYEHLVTTEHPEVGAFLVPKASHLISSVEERVSFKDNYSSLLQGLLSPKPKPEVGAMSATDATDVVTSAVDAAMNHGNETGTRPDMEPTHYSMLDANVLKVNELRNELAARNLVTKGLKVNLVYRLQVDSDEEKKASAPEESKTAEDTKAEGTPAKAKLSMQTKDESNDLPEKERRRLEHPYCLNHKPVITNHPNKSVRGSHFDCHRVSFFSLLNNRTEEQRNRILRSPHLLSNSVR